MSNEKKSFEPLPAGDYLVRMNRITEKTSKKGNQMLSVGYQVVDGDNKDRLIFEHLLLDHANPKVGEITADRVNKYLQAIGVEGGLETIGHDFSQLSNYLEIPFVASVKVEPGKDGWADSNKIAKFSRR